MSATELGQSESPMGGQGDIGMFSSVDGGFVAQSISILAKGCRHLHRQKATPKRRWREVGNELYK
jgi:hypothetical protein